MGYFISAMNRELKDYQVVNIGDKITDQKGRIFPKYSATQHPTSLHPIIWEEVLPLYFNILGKYTQIKKNNLIKDPKRSLEKFFKVKKERRGITKAIDEDTIIRLAKSKGKMKRKVRSH